MSTPTQKLRTLLHFGGLGLYYDPNERILKDKARFFSMTDTIVDFIQIIKEGKFLEVCNIILKAFSDGYSAHPKMLVAVLVACVCKGFCRRENYQQLREAGFKAAKIICSSTENFFLLLNHSEVKGRKCRQFVKDWYMSKDAKTLAEIVGKNKKLYKISHKETIKRHHIKPEGPAHAAIFKYLLFGIKAAKKEFEGNSEANEVLNYLQVVEDFRRMKDEQQAARYIEMYHFTLDHVPPHLLKSKEVWNSLIANLPLPVLLKNLQNMGNKGFLKPNSVLVNKVIDALNNETAIAESQIHPSHVYVELRNYECSSKILAAEKAKRKRDRIPGVVRPKKIGRISSNPPNPKIISALYDLFATTCKMCLAPTGLRYFVAIDLKNVQSTDPCYGCLCVSPVQATILTCLCLLHAEHNVAIHIKSNHEEPVPLPLTNEMTFQEGIKKLEEVQMHRVEIATPIDWALKMKEEYDVFILLLDRNIQANDIEQTLQKYRDAMKLPNVKYIIINLKFERGFYWKIGTKDPGIFKIAGFDRHVPRLIESFSRGAF